MLLYVWVLYPLVLAILPARRSRPRTGCQEAEPTVTAPSISLVVSAYNEEGAIEAKIRNFLQSDYPGRSELLIASDGSSDRTVEIASRFISDRVHLFVEATNRGKGEALSWVLPLVRGEIVVFSDATSIFSRDALNHLIRPFADPEVGLVTGSVQVRGNRVAGLYRRYENLLEKLEARGGSISTAHGCIYAIRRSLLHDHDPTLTDDFVQPILVTLQGARVAVAPDAVCYESIFARPYGSVSKTGADGRAGFVGIFPFCTGPAAYPAMASALCVDLAQVFAMADCSGDGAARPCDSATGGKFAAIHPRAGSGGLVRRAGGFRGTFCASRNREPNHPVLGFH